MSFHVPGIGWCCTAEEDAAGVTTPTSAFDRILRLAHLSFITIHLLEPEERNRAGRLTMNPWDHVRRLQAMKEMVTLTGEAIAARRAWQDRQAVGNGDRSWVIPEAPSLAEASARHQRDDPVGEASDKLRRDAA